MVPQDYTHTGRYRGASKPRRSKHAVNKKAVERALIRLTEYDVPEPPIVISDSSLSSDHLPPPLGAETRRRLTRSQSLALEVAPGKKGGSISRELPLEKEFVPYTDNIAYEYYDDPNEICDRLRLLVMSKASGNTNHDQEINSIIEELREAYIIG